VATWPPLVPTLRNVTAGNAVAVVADEYNLASELAEPSELSCAVIDQSPTGNCFALRLRLSLAGEHLDRAEGDHDDLRNPIDLFEAFAQTAKNLDAWHAAGLANGGTSCEDPPGIRDGGFGKMYLAYLRDPDGNKLCGFYRIPADQ